MRYRLRTLLLVPAFVCFAGAYRFGSHGISDGNSFCIGLAVSAMALGLVLSGVALWNT